MTYELWDLPSGTALGEFATEGEALAAVRGLLADHGPGAAVGLLLVRTSARGRSSPVAQEQALAAPCSRQDVTANYGCPRIL